MAKIKNQEDSKVALLLAELEPNKTISNGRASFKGWGYSTARVHISRLVVLNGDIPDVERNRIVSSAIFAAASAGKLTNKSFLAALNRKEREYIDLPDKEFRFVNQIALCPQLCPRRLKSLDCIISFNIQKNGVLYREHSKTVAHVARLQVPRLPKGYTPLSVSCKARSVSSAFEKAGTALDFWRGSFNLGINRVKSWRISFDRRAPVNVVLLHPVATVHYPSGRLADTSWSYDAGYQIEFQTLKQLQDHERGQFYFCELREKLREHPYRQPVVTSIARYVRALDSVNWEAAYIQLWSICEQLTLTTKSDSKQTIKLIKSIYSDEKYIDVVLQVLKEFRNRTVHLGEETQDLEALLFQLKCIVEDLICFHAFNRFKFETLAQATEAMALSSNLEALEIRRSLIGKAISLRRWVSSE